MKYTISIKKNRVFHYILKKGRYFKGKYMVVYTSGLNDNNINCLGICVNKKHGISVHRNKMKRWIREIYTKEEKKLKKGYNIVVLYKKNITIDMLSFEVIAEDLKTCFKGLDLYEI